jgi:hypothetical protein
MLKYAKAGGISHLSCERSSDSETAEIAGIDSIIDNEEV